MSDYLFRMVERAAGRAAASAPQPPRESHWPVAMEAPESFTVPIRPHARNQAKNSTLEIPLFPPELHRSFSPSPPATPRTSRPDGITQGKNFAPDVVLGESAPVESVTRVPTVLADEHRPLVSREDEPLVSSGNPSLPSEIATQSANRTEEIRGTEIQNSSRDPMISVPQIAETAEDSVRFNSSAPQVQFLHPTQTPLPAASARVPADARPSEAFTLGRGESPRLPAARNARQQSEPGVEVKIGRVEVRFDALAPAAPARPSRPSGFAEFAALRRYETQPWPSGNR